MNLDLWLFYLLHNLAGRHGSLDAFIHFCAEYLPYIAAAGFAVWLVTAAYGRREKIEIAAVAGAAALLSRGVFTEIIRLFVHRDRPFTALPIEALGRSDNWSFPSGHAAFFFALSTAVWLYNRRAGTWLFALTALITLARVASGVHYPSDILGGALAGIASAFLVFWAYTTYLKKGTQ